MLGKFVSAYKARRRFRNKERAWERSPRRKAFEAELDLPPRILQLEEERLIRWMLEHGSEEARLFLPQLEGIKAVRACICGCPSIRLVVADDLPSQSAYSDRIICDWVGRTSKDELVGTMLIQVAGKLVELEIYCLDGEIKSETQEFGLPEISTLEPFSPGAGARIP